MNESMKSHSMILENRNILSLTGVKDVIGFNDDTVNLLTEMGKLIVKGNNLHISKLNLESGEVTIDGKITSLTYLNDNDNTKGLKRIFK